MAKKRKESQKWYKDSRGIYVRTPAEKEAHRLQERVRRAVKNPKKSPLVRDKEWYRRPGETTRQYIERMNRVSVRIKNNWVNPRTGKIHSVYEKNMWIKMIQVLENFDPQLADELQKAGFDTLQDFYDWLKEKTGIEIARDFVTSETYGEWITTPLSDTGAEGDFIPYDGSARVGGANVSGKVNNLKKLWEEFMKLRMIMNRELEAWERAFVRGESKKVPSFMTADEWRRIIEREGAKTVQDYKDTYDYYVKSQDSVRAKKMVDYLRGADELSLVRDDYEFAHRLWPSIYKDRYTWAEQVELMESRISRKELKKQQKKLQKMLKGTEFEGTR